MKKVSFEATARHSDSATTDFLTSRRCSSRRRRLTQLALTSLAISISSALWAAEAPKAAEQATKDANAALLKELPFTDKTSFELAHKGFIAPLPDAMIKGEKGNLVWDPTKYNVSAWGTTFPFLPQAQIFSETASTPSA